MAEYQVFNKGLVSAGGLRFQAVNSSVNPRLCGFRVLYSGPMRCNNGESYAEANVRLRFKMLTDPVNPSIDFCPKMLATSIATEENFVECLSSFLFLEYSRKIEQTGQIRGKFSIEKDINQDLCLNGVHCLSTGRIVPTSASFELYARFQRGLVISLTSECQTNDKTNHIYGFLTQQNGYVYPVTWSDFHLANLPKDDVNFPDSFEINMVARKS